MPLIRPFPGLRPFPKHAAEVIAPPYDVLTTEEAHQRARGRPWSFLHISKPEIDLPPNTDPYSDAVYAKGYENFRQLFDMKIVLQDESPSYYFYRLTMGNHQQTGIVASANVADYNTNRIRKHELTRPDKEDDRVRHLEALHAQTGPVLLTYKHHATLDDLVNTFTSTVTPIVEVTADDGIKHTFWLVNDLTIRNQITQLVDNMECLYIADGHHRSAAASRVAARRQTNHPSTGQEEYNYFLAVLFPDTQMQILAYNRVVKDLNGLTPTDFLNRLTQSFTVQLSSQPVTPKMPGEFGMYLQNKWYQLFIQADKIPHSDPVASLDVSLLTDQLLTPILGITDLRRDKRIDFVGGIRGVTELEKRVNSGEMAVAFALYPTSMQALMAVADAGQIMPPKSTWFEPKLADGLISHLT